MDDVETLAQAATREACEETGLVVQPERIVGIHLRPQWFSLGSHGVVFGAKTIAGKLGIQPQEVLEVRFLDRNELPEGDHLEMEGKVDVYYCES